MRTVVVGDLPAPFADWLEERKRLGQDLYDEVWEGEYHVAPMAHSRHGDIQGQLLVRLGSRARQCGLWPGELRCSLERPTRNQLFERVCAREAVIVTEPAVAAARAERDGG